MVLGNRDRERFWIALTVRIAFGFMFLIAAINMFFADPLASVPENLKTVSTGLAGPFATTWVGQSEVALWLVRAFLMVLPFAFTVLAILLLTGLYLRPALRASAILLVILGLGKYLTDQKSGSTITTLQDFMYAMFITLALFTLSKEPEELPAPPGS